MMMRMGGGMVSPSTAAMPRAKAHTSGGTKAYATGGRTAAAIVGASAAAVDQDGERVVLALPAAVPYQDPVSGAMTTAGLATVTFRDRP